MLKIQRQKMSLLSLIMTIMVPSFTANAYFETTLEFRKPLLGVDVKTIKNVHLDLFNDNNTNSKSILTKDLLKSKLGIDGDFLKKTLGKELKWEVLADNVRLDDSFLKTEKGEKLSFLFVMPESPFAKSALHEPSDKINFSLKAVAKKIIKETTDFLGTQFLLELVNIKVDSAKVTTAWMDKILKFPVSKKVQTIGELKKTIAGGVLAVIVYKEKIKDSEEKDDQKKKVSLLDASLTS